MSLINLAAELARFEIATDQNLTESISVDTKRDIMKAIGAGIRGFRNRSVEDVLSGIEEDVEDALKGIRDNGDGKRFWERVQQEFASLLGIGGRYPDHLASSWHEYEERSGEEWSDTLWTDQFSHSSGHYSRHDTPSDGERDEFLSRLSDKLPKTLLKLVKWTKRQS